MVSGYLSIFFFAFCIIYICVLLSSSFFEIVSNCFELYIFPTQARISSYYETDYSSVSVSVSVVSVPFPVEPNPPWSLSVADKSSDTSITTFSGNVKTI
jgi:hypothetical protein